MKNNIVFNTIKADYECEKCHQKRIKISIEESLYSGAPYCEDCLNEMSLIRLYKIK